MKSGKKPPAVDGSEAAPDYEFWVTMPSWTREEAIALLTGRDPANPNPNQPSNQHLQKMEILIDRAFSSGAFPNAVQVSPSDCVSTAASSNVPLPDALLKAMNKRKIELKNWKLECERLRAENERLAKLLRDPTSTKSKPSENITALKKKIGSLQVALLGIAIDKFRMKREWQNSSVAKNIASSIAQAGLKLDEDTVRSHLSDAMASKGKDATFHS